MITSLSIGRGGLGRFGNNCFTIAGTIGIAIKSGQPYSFPRWHTYDNAIFGNPVDDIEQYLLNSLPRIPDDMRFNEAGYWWGWKDIFLPNGNWTIDAHLQSERYFKHCLPLIRETFTFKDEYPKNDYVAIHYRAGDYIDDPNAYHPRCSKEYYEKAMAEFPLGTNFIILTDDPESAVELFGGIKGYTFQIAAEYLKNAHVRYKYEKPDYIADFVFMKKCKSFITANSSFSLMAAILGDHPEKKIIMPKLWFGSQAGDIETKDLYPENAIIL